MTAFRPQAPARTFNPVIGLLVLAVLFGGPDAARADRLPTSSPRVVDYRISVVLDTAAKRLTGQERVVWTNPSTDAVPDLYFHLYLNAFRNTLSTFYRESEGQLRGDEMPDRGWGWIDVTAMRLADGTDLLPAFRFVHPDDDNADDRTVARVELPRPVAPGASVEIDIEFTARLPGVFARTGYRGDFYLVGQWFPKLGVYEPAGLRGRAAGGWNRHQFHANSEFYADFGHYLVELTVPAGFVVGATGQRIRSANNDDGTVTSAYEQDNVHDFAWTADPDYVELWRRFEPADEVSDAEYADMARRLARPVDELRLSPVDITVLMQPSRLPQAERYVESAKRALKYFGLRYGRYPYPTLTIVDPAPGAGGAGGMEYPTFITGGTAWPLNFWPLSGIRAAEAVTVHELGHQYWYGLVGSNEFEEAWLDEGLTSYSTGRLMEDAYGVLVDLPGLRVSETDLLRLQNTPGMVFDTIRQPAWTYRTSAAYDFYAYTKPEIALRTLERYLGAETMARIMRTYSERWRFRHPSSDDFYAVADEVAGHDLGWFFRQVFESPGILDHEVTVSSTHVEAPRGVLGGASARGGDAAVPLGDTGPALYASAVVVSRRGSVWFPLDIAVKFEGQPPERVRWAGTERWTRFRFIRPGRLEWAAADPDHDIPLDVAWWNNARRVEPDDRVAAHWTSRLSFWLQNVLASLMW